LHTYWVGNTRPTPPCVASVKWWPPKLRQQGTRGNSRMENLETMSDSEGRTEPLVSVVIPAYNHEQFVARAIQSVLEQDYINIELVVIDDGSRDGTWAEICRARSNSSRPFLAITQSNSGISKTLNLGIRAACGEFVAVLASDDMYLPQKISRQMNVMRKAPASLGLVHTGAYLDHQQGGRLEDITHLHRPARGDCFMRMLMQSERVIAPSVLFRREVFERVGGFDENLAAEDIDFFLRVAAAGFDFAFIPEPLLIKRTVEGSMGGKLELLIEVGDRIIDKHKHRLSPSEYRNWKRINSRNIVMMAARCGDFSLAWRQAWASRRERGALQAAVEAGFWSLWRLASLSLPSHTRRNLRTVRSMLLAKYRG
jgi:alpha-1,3-rhamnosyltransferase